ncbi:MAG: pyruvate kinase [Planctomycetota bacterium]
MPRARAGAVVTVGPHAPFVGEVARHPFVVGLRLNTVMPYRGTRREVLERLASHGQPLLIDLKGRQLRVAEAAVPPFTAVRLSHRIQVPTPCTAVFKGGSERVEVLAVDGDRLILADGPQRVLGPGESVNLPHPELEVEGVLTREDEAWIAAARELGLHDYLLSFTEAPEDLDAVRALDPRATVRAKIESQKGLAFAKAHPGTPLMAARGDLYLEVEHPHEVLAATRAVLACDPGAIVASRILDSLAWQGEPTCAELGDLAFLSGIGYRRFMLGDEVCLRRDTVLEALNALEATVLAELGR